MRRLVLIVVASLLVALCGPVAPVWAQAAATERPNLLINAGFEAGEDGWERRSANGEERVLTMAPEAARTGKTGARIVNRTQTDSRWRQGHDKGLRVEPGSVIRLTGWIRSDLGNEGYAALRLYGMTDEGEITAQPTSRPLAGKTDWTRSTVNLKVPARTSYIMAYLELPGGVGTADYDDLELVLVSAAKVREGNPDLLLLTNAPESDLTVQSLHTLYPGRLVAAAPGEALDGAKYRGAIALETGAEAVVDMAALEAFAKGGGQVVVDLALYARARGLTVKEQPVEAAQAILRITAEHPVTRGFKAGDTIPWYVGASDKPARRSLQGKVPGTVLGEAPDGTALLVIEQVGKGVLLATDLTGLSEPLWKLPGAFNKYLFAGNLLGQSVHYGRHFERKVKYAEFVAMMRALAGRHKGLELRDEGPAQGEDRMYSLNMGDADKPAMFVYAAAHGSEWEPAYGLLALAERLLERPEEGLFDFKRYRLVMIPIMNPWGYDNVRRHNLNQVDLNRNGDTRWQEYVGRANADAVYGPSCYDWKGTGPFSELETQAWKRVLDRLKPVAVLDFHGNAGGAGNNRLIFIPATGKAENEDRVHDAARRFDEAMADRYVLHEASRPGVQQYAMETIGWEQIRPTLINSGCRDRLGFVVEVPAGYAATYGLVLQTDIVIETCLAFFRACE